MKTIALSSLISFFLFSSSIPASPQNPIDSVNATVTIMPAGEDVVVVSAVVMPNKNSATVYFELMADGRTFGINSFSGEEGGSISYAFRITGLKCGTSYELKFIAFSNNDSKQILGQEKFKLPILKCPEPEADNKKKRKK